MLRPMVVRRFSSKRVAVVAACLAWAAASAPKLAWACPACAADSRNVEFLKMGSLFVLLPFAVVGLVLLVLRQAPERKAASLRRV